MKEGRMAVRKKRQDIEPRKKDKQAAYLPDRDKQRRNRTAQKDCPKVTQTKDRDLQHRVKILLPMAQSNNKANT